MQLPRLRRDQYLSILLLSWMVAFGAGDPRSIQEAVSEAQASPSLELIDTAPIPIRLASATASADTASPIGNNDLPVLTAQAAMVIDLPSASILYEKNARTYQYPASTTKLMTALLAVDTYDLNQGFVVQEEAQSRGTTVGLLPGMEVTLLDALRAALIQSGNDAAFLLANNYPGGYEAFVARMNAKAQELHLEHTTFSNPSGLDSETQLTTASDLSLLTRVFLTHELLSEIVATPSTSITDQVTGKSYWIYTTNRLLHQDSRYRGVKTGTTEKAGEVLVSRFQENERDFLIVVMHSDDRYDDTKNLVNWVLRNFQWIEVQNP